MFESLVPYLPLMAKLGAYMGIIGGLFNCTTKINYKVVAFCIWLLSNCILIIWAYELGEHEMAQMYSFFCITSGIGLFTHWKLKKKEGV